MKGILALHRTEQAEPGGRILNAQQFANEVCGGHVSAKYVIKHFAHQIGSKPGKEWLFYETDAKLAWAIMMPRKRLSA